MIKLQQHVLRKLLFILLEIFCPQKNQFVNNSDTQKKKKKKKKKKKLDKQAF
jgi:hypothetical protein